MKRTLTLAALAATCLAVASPALAQRGPDSRFGQQQQAAQEDARFNAAQTRFATELQIFQAAFDRYQRTRTTSTSWNDPRFNDPRNDPRYMSDDRDEGDYDPSQYYRDGPRYQERVLASDERVYRGRNGQYYCKRSDGTTGLIVGGIAGATLGNVIDGGHSRAAGTILGAIIGATAGAAIDRSNNQNQQIRCR